MNPRVSVVVPTCRRPGLLRRCLAALLSQDLDPSLYEIIIVDDGPDDATRRVVEAAAGVDGAAPAAGRLLFEAAAAARGVSELADEEVAAPDVAATDLAAAAGVAASGGIAIEISPALTWVTAAEPANRGRAAVRYVPVVGRHGPAAARNCGWQAAAGEIIAFTDDDCIPAPGWLAAGLAAFDDERVLGVSGRILMPLCAVPTDYERNATGLVRSQFVTANCFYRRTALQDVGGFDERFALAWREDTELYFRLVEEAAARSAGDVSRAAFTATEDAVVVHPVRPAAWGVSLRQQRKNLYNALLYKKHPRLYRRSVQAAPPWDYYVTLAAAAETLAGAAAGEPAVALGGFAIWAALTLRFCGRRLAGTSRAPAHVAEMLITSALIPPVAVFWRLAGALRYRVWFL